MTLPLESKIMEEIGFGHHYTYENGAGVCRMIRERGVEKLPERINHYHTEDPTQISEAYQPLIETLKDISTADSEAYHDFKIAYEKLAEFQDRVEEVGMEQARAEKQEKERTAYRMTGAGTMSRHEVMTNTWISASYIIAEHINTASASEEDRTAAFDRLNSSLKLDCVVKMRLYKQLTHFAHDGVDAHQMLALGRQIDSAKSQDELKGYLDTFMQSLPEHYQQMGRMHILDLAHMG